MKKRFKPMMLILFLLLVVYTVFAAWKTHGIGIYGIGNTIGKILAVSWHYTALAAAILLLIFMIVLFTRKTREKHGKIVPAAAQPEASAAESKDGPADSKRKKTVKEKSVKGKTTDKMPTAAPVRAAEPPIAPAAPIAAAESAAQAPVPTSDETVLLTEDTSAPDTDATVLLTEDAPAPDPDATVLLAEEESASNEKKDASVFCEKCGAALAAGVKFCSKCGTKTHVE